MSRLSFLLLSFMSVYAYMRACVFVSVDVFTSQQRRKRRYQMFDVHTCVLFVLFDMLDIYMYLFSLNVCAYSISVSFIFIVFIRE